MKTLKETVADIKRQNRESLKYEIKHLRERHKAIAKVVLAGVFTLENISDDVLKYGYSQKITRDDLPKLYKHFGKPTIIGKSVADNGIDIKVNVSFAKLKNLRFTYTRPYNPELGNCRIEEVTQTHTSKQLVCRAE